MNIPEWIEQDISPYTIGKIIDDGCRNGAYEPANTYWIAKQVMHDHGDDVLKFIYARLDDMPEGNVPEMHAAWGAICCWFLRTAVELWCLENEQWAKWGDE
jgi:hypothetical protein|tara:strand:+ start:288 stop:590 length:303 start_codon:yes stop_codon:yes gene_type:complete